MTKYLILFVNHLSFFIISILSWKIMGGETISIMILIIAVNIWAITLFCLLKEFKENKHFSESDKLEELKKWLLDGIDYFYKIKSTNKNNVNERINSYWAVVAKINGLK